MTITAATDALIAAREEETYARATRLIAAGITELNELLGLDRPVTFGYIGNCSASFDDRSWRIFLPNGDHLGGFATGDAAGARHTYARLAAMIDGVKLARLFP